MARHKQGSMKTHRQPWTAEQEAKLRQAVSEGRFRMLGEKVRWCGEVLEVEVSEGKVYYWFWRWGYWKKVLRPLGERAHEQAQEARGKGAFGSPPAAEGEAAGRNAVSVGVFAFGGGPDKEAADLGVVGAGAGCGTGRGFAAVEITGSGIEADLSAALFT